MWQIILNWRPRQNKQICTVKCTPRKPLADRYFKSAEIFLNPVQARCSSAFSSGTSSSAPHCPKYYTNLFYLYLIYYKFPFFSFLCCSIMTVFYASYESSISYFLSNLLSISLTPLFFLVIFWCIFNCHLLAFVCFLTFFNIN